MPALDPDKATAAYLAILSNAEQAKAIAYTHGSEWLLLWGGLLGIVSAWLILRSGLLNKLRLSVPRRNLAVFLCVLAFFALDWVIRSPMFAYADWLRERSYGLTTQAFTGWLGESLLSAAINALCISLLAVAIYALMRRSPRKWWAWSALVTILAILFLVVITPIVIQPLFNRYQPAPAGPTRDAIIALAERAGVPSSRVVIYDGSKQSERYTARVSGMLGTAQIAMSDTMFQQGADIPEVRAVLGHEMGHYKRGHVFVTALVLSLLAMVMLFVTDRLFPIVLRWCNSAERIGGVADPAGVPIFAMILVVLGMLTTPITNTLVRAEENDADRFSLEHANEPDGMARALVKTIAYRAASPSVIEEAIFYSHPSVERRVRRAMVWKAEHPEHVGE